MKKLWTTSEYIHKIKKNVARGFFINLDGGNFNLYSNKKTAQKDCEWLKNYSAKLAKRYGGPEVIEVVFRKLPKRKAKK